jgi:hypothetical protein
VPYDRVPRTADHEAQVQWMYDWWQRIDAWITENRPGNAAVPAALSTPESGSAEPVGDLSGGLRGRRLVAGNEEDVDAGRIRLLDDPPYDRPREADVPPAVMDGADHSSDGGSAR